MEKGPGLTSLQVTGLPSGNQDLLMHSAKQSNLWKQMFFSSTDSMKVGGIITADNSPLVFTAPNTDPFNQNPLLHPVMLLLSSKCHWRSRILPITLLTTSWSEDHGYIDDVIKAPKGLLWTIYSSVQLPLYIWTGHSTHMILLHWNSTLLYCIHPHTAMLLWKMLFLLYFSYIVYILYVHV